MNGESTPITYLLKGEGFYIETTPQHIRELLYLGLGKHITIVIIDDVK